MNSDQVELLNKAFSPSAPIQSRELFFGRPKQTESTLAAINERGQHFVIYGERGVGKTSLANVISYNLLNVVISKVTCSRDESFKQVWSKALARIKLVKEIRGIGFAPEYTESEVQLDLFLPNDACINSMDIQDALQRVTRPVLLIFDEFDSVADEAFKVSFADTIKNLSDNASHVTIGIVGISESVEALVGQHSSLERCLKQISMPRMSKGELGQIVDKGLAILKLSAEPSVRNRVVDFSSGFPHFTHLLMKHAAKHCLQASSSCITMEQLRNATDDAIDDSSQSLRDSYQKAIIASKEKSKFEDVLSACALTAVDDFGAFAIRDLVTPYYMVTGDVVKARTLSYNVQKLCTSERGTILTRIGESRNVRYTFTNPIMKVFAKLKLEQKGSYQQPNLFD